MAPSWDFFPDLLVCFQLTHLLKNGQDMFIIKLVSKLFPIKKNRTKIQSINKLIGTAVAELWTKKTASFQAIFVAMQKKKKV